MDSKTLREKYLKFFERNEHKIIPSASLVPSEDEQLQGKEKVLFTSAGMQPLIPYLTGQKESPSKRLVNVQKCFRTDDIEEVGDLVHHTFFEMLGNWSIGDYWKEEAIKLSFEFLTKELEIPVNKLAITVFAGDEDAPRDEESARAWESLGIPRDRIYYFGKEYNWWPSGEKSGPCGPDTEMFYWTGKGAPEGKPNEDIRWVEIWNDVFMQFNRKSNGPPAGGLEDLPQKNVDTGMGLERTLAVLNGLDDDYQTDLYAPIIQTIVEVTGKDYTGENKVPMRIIADHMKAATFLISERIVPSNKLQGYVLRRLLRRSAVKFYELTEDIRFINKLSIICNVVIEIYDNLFNIKNNDSTKKLTQRIILDEISKFGKNIQDGMNKIRKIGIGKLTPEFAFNLYQSNGFPPDLTFELLNLSNLDKDKFIKKFETYIQNHQEQSRAASAGMFKGGLAGHSEIEIKYHTATHLLHQALRDVLGPQVFQKGSNINPERLRFDFSFDRKMTDEEIKKVENLVNQKIKEDLKVDQKQVSIEEAKKMGAIGLFNDKYGKDVSVYKIGDYSIELCGGPHVKNTGVIGGIKITKEEAVSVGIRRIRAQLV